MTSGGSNFNHFAENRLTKFSARDAGDFSDAAGEREMAPKYGSLLQDAGDLVGLIFTNLTSTMHYWRVMTASHFEVKRSTLTVE